MNFIVSSSVLQKQLQLLSSIISSSNIMPILSNYLFELENNVLTITASDLETIMTTKVAVRSESDGKLAIPAKMLLETMKSFPEMPVNFQIDTNNFSIEIVAGDGRYQLSGFDADDFPKLPALTEDSQLNINSITLAQSISKTVFATGNDELRPAMNGVFVNLALNEITFVATDAHKLVRYKRFDVNSDVESSFILPKKPLNILKNILGSIDTEVKIQYTNTNAYFTFDETFLVCRLVDAKYPNYEGVIPTENPFKLIVGKDILINTLQRISIYANKSSMQVRFKITGSELQISAQDNDFNNSGIDRLTCNYVGEDIEIAFNSRFLLETLRNLDTENVMFELSSPSRACLVLPDLSNNTEENLLMLVMPVMISN
jgi:DNA polymerase III subunit beta